MSGWKAGEIAPEISGAAVARAGKEELTGWDRPIGDGYTRAGVGQAERGGVSGVRDWAAEEVETAQREQGRGLSAGLGLGFRGFGLDWCGFWVGLGFLFSPSLFYF